MYTAIVLICMGGFKAPDNCYTYTHEVLHKTRRECEQVIYEAVSNKIFTITDPETGSVEKPADWYCVNWESMKASY